MVPVNETSADIECGEGLKVCSKLLLLEAFATVCDAINETRETLSPPQRFERPNGSIRRRTSAKRMSISRTSLSFSRTSIFLDFG